MKFTLKAPCGSCPFRCDKHFHLSFERRRGIAKSLHGDGSFPCHKTLDYDDDSGGRQTDQTQHCAGALIILELEERPNQMMRIMERIGCYDRRQLKMDAPVYDDLREWVSAGDSHE